jgi:hypothetical protein
MDFSDHEHSFHLDFSDTSTQDDVYSFAKNKIQLAYDDVSFAFSTNTATTVDATYADAALSGTQALLRKNAFRERKKNLCTIIKGQR